MGGWGGNYGHYPERTEGRGQVMVIRHLMEHVVSEKLQHVSIPRLTPLRCVSILWSLVHEPELDQQPQHPPVVVFVAKMTMQRIAGGQGTVVLIMYAFTHHVTYLRSSRFAGQQRRDHMLEVGGEMLLQQEQRLVHILRTHKCPRRQ